MKLLLLQSGVYQTSIVWYRPASVAADKAMMEILYGFKSQLKQIEKNYDSGNLHLVHTV